MNHEIVLLGGMMLEVLFLDDVAKGVSYHV